MISSAFTEALPYKLGEGIRWRFSKEEMMMYVIRVDRLGGWMLTTEAEHPAMSWKFHFVTTGRATEEKCLYVASHTRHALSRLINTAA